MRTLISALALTLFSIHINAQCTCEPPAVSGTEVIVRTAQELNNALHQANNQNGNVVITLENGIYELHNNLLYISENMRNLTIRSASGDRDSVIIRGQGMGGSVGYIFNVAADNFTLLDMTIGWVSNHAVQIHAEHDADAPLIQNVRFVDIREQMLKVSGNNSPTFSDNGVVECCLFEFTEGVGFQYYTGGIDAHRAKDWLVRYNTFRDIRSPDGQLAEHAIHFWSESEGTDVRNNHIMNCDRGIGFGLTSDPDRGHHGGIIINNFVHTSRDVGIGLEQARGARVYNNTVITDNYFNSIEYRFDSTYQADIFNNLVSENIASRNGGTGTLGNNYTVTDMGIFVDPEAYDYHLSMPVAGIISSGSINVPVFDDIDCAMRKDFGFPDIGADEYQNVITNIDTETPNTIRVFPNPAFDEVFVESQLPYDHIRLVNQHGQTVRSVVRSGNTMKRINLRGLTPGLYYLHLSGSSLSSQWQKLVVHD